jgi:hypothetical protein
MRGDEINRAAGSRRGILSNLSGGEYGLMRKKVAEV